MQVLVKMLGVMSHVSSREICDRVRSIELVIWKVTSALLGLKRYSTL